MKPPGHRLVVAVVSAAVLILAACGSDGGAASPDAAPVGDAGPIASEELVPGVFAASSLFEDAPDEALAPLGPIIGDARFVGLGESVHTVGTYYRAKARVFRWLVEVHGFRAFGFETPWVGARSLATWIADACPGGDAALEEQMNGGLFGVWVSTETAATFQFMCAWNAAHPDDELVFYGFDAQQAYDEGAVLLGAVPTLWPERAAELDAGLRTCDGVGLTAAEYWGRIYLAGGGTQPLVFDAGRHATCLATLDGVDAALDNERAALTLAHGARAVTEVALAAGALRASELAMFHYEDPSFVTGGEPDETLSFESRDVFMARALVEIADLEAPGARAAIWAHNTHIARHHDEVVSGPQAGIHTMGTFADQALGDAYRNVALVARDVVVNWPGLATGSIGEQPEGALELRLDALGRSPLIVNLARQELFDRALAMPVQNGDVMVPGRHFDAALYFAVTEGMTLFP